MEEVNAHLCSSLIETSRTSPSVNALILLNLVELVSYDDLVIEMWMTPLYGYVCLFWLDFISLLTHHV